MTKKELSAEILRYLLDYNATTGVFTWRIATTNAIKVGAVTGTVRANGYRRIQLLGRFYYAHRLAWLYVNGHWPMGEIDHLDGLRDNNCYSNLRDVPRMVNLQNQRRAHKNNKSGMLGVKFDKSTKKWMALIRPPKGKQKYLGLFPTKEAAHAAYLSEKRKLHVGCTL